MSRPLVEILYFEGCPNHQGAREAVERVAAELRLQPVIAMVEVADATAAAEHRFLGSPTVRVDGRDVEPGADERLEFVLACRIYRSNGGSAGRPSDALIRSAFAAAAA